MKSSSAEAFSRLKVTFAVETVAADKGTVLTIRPVATLGLAPRGGDDQKK